MSRKHALLSASGASKWLNCTPSAVLESKIEGITSSYADEGTLAHDLAEVTLNYYLKRINKEAYNKELIELQESEYFNESMAEYVNEYVDYCIERYTSYKNVSAGIEETVSLEPYIEKGFSHLDFRLIGNNDYFDTLEIIDYKHGKGIPVYAKDNKQLLIYALGAYLEHGFIYNIQTISLTVFQPRIENITHWELSIRELLDWAENELKPKAEIAYKGEGEPKAGDWCRFCKAKHTCRAFAEMNLNLANLDFENLKDMETVEGLLYEDVNKQTWHISDEEITAIVKGAELFKNWLNGILEYALNQAKQGKQYPGLKLVHGRSIRKYTDTDKIIDILTRTWAEDYITTRKLLPITSLEKLIGKDNMKLIADYIIKPEGNISLVPDSDKRPEYNSIQDAKNDFEKY